MKFPTQHKNVKKQDARECYNAHRDGDTTWCSKLTGDVLFNTIKHESVAAAKQWMASS